MKATTYGEALSNFFMEVLILIPLSHGAGQISIAALVFFF